MISVLMAILVLTAPAVHTRLPADGASPICVLGESCTPYQTNGNGDAVTQSDLNTDSVTVTNDATSQVSANVTITIKNTSSGTTSTEPVTVTPGNGVIYQAPSGHRITTVSVGGTGGRVSGQICANTT